MKDDHTVTDLAKLRGKSGLIPLISAIFSTKICMGTIESKCEVCLKCATYSTKSYF